MKKGCGKQHYLGIAAVATVRVSLLDLDLDGVDVWEIYSGIVKPSGMPARALNCSTISKMEHDNAHATPNFKRKCKQQREIGVIGFQPR